MSTSFVLITFFVFIFFFLPFTWKYFATPKFNFGSVQHLRQFSTVSPSKDSDSRQLFAELRLRSSGYAACYWTEHSKYWGSSKFELRNLAKMQKQLQQQEENYVFKERGKGDSSESYQNRDDTALFAKHFQWKGWYFGEDFVAVAKYRQPYKLDTYTLRRRGGGGEYECLFNCLFILYTGNRMKMFGPGTSLAGLLSACVRGTQHKEGKTELAGRQINNPFTRTFLGKSNRNFIAKNISSKWL